MSVGEESSMAVMLENKEQIFCSQQKNKKQKTNNNNNKKNKEKSPVRKEPCCTFSLSRKYTENMAIRGVLRHFLAVRTKSDR